MVDASSSPNSPVSAAPETPPTLAATDPSESSDTASSEGTVAPACPSAPQSPAHDDERAAGGGDDAAELSEDLLMQFASIYSRHAMSKNSLADAYDFTVEHIEELYEMKRRWGGLPSFQTLLRRVRELLPDVRLDVAFRNRSTGEITIERGLTAYPKKAYPTQQWEEIYTLTRTPVRALIRLHAQEHGGRPVRIVQMQEDDFPETKSATSPSVDMVTLIFDGCRVVYPVRCLRALDRDHVKPLRMGILWDTLVDELNEEGVEVRCISGDAPKRAALLGIVAHSGTYSCGCCKAPSHKVKKVGEKKSMVFSPHESRGKPLRTSEESHSLAQRLRSGELRRGAEELAGITGFSPLWRLTNWSEPEKPYDLVNRVPADFMHLCGLGIVKRAFRKTVDCDTTTKGCKGEMKYTEYNKLICKVRVPSEFSRRVRKVSPRSTAEEHLITGMFLFVVIVDNCHYGGRHSRFWARLGYFMRAMILPQDEFDAIDDMDWEKFAFGLTLLHEATLGESASTYNTHGLLHLPSWREKFGPLTTVWTMPNERFYASYKLQSYPGSMSTAKQAFQASFMRLSQGHSCRRRLKLSPRVTDACDDSLVYTFDGLSGYTFYQLKEQQEADQWTARKISVRVFKTADDVVGKTGRFAQVGVFTYQGLEQESVILTRDGIQGKCMRAGRAIATIPTNFIE